jgi:hypothetical protein
MKTGTVAMIAGDMGGYNFMEPVRRKLLARGRRVQAKANPRLADQLNGPPGAWQIDDDLALDRLSQPGIVVVGVSRAGAAEKILIEESRAARIPTIVPIDTWSNYAERFSDYSAGTVSDRLRYLPDIILLNDEDSCRRAIADGLPEDRLRVSGSPHLESICSVADLKVRRARIRQEFDLPDDRFVILFASEPFTSYPSAGQTFDETSVLSDLAQAIAAARPEALLLINPHPYNRQGALDGVDLSNVDHHFIDTPSLDAVAAADLVVGMRSMLLIEAALLGRPVVSHQPGLFGKDDFIANERGLSLACYTRRDLTDALGSADNLRTSNRIDAVAAAHVGAAARIADLIEEAMI